MNNIPTPRTDAEWNNLDGQWRERAIKLCHFTQELERELFTTREQLLESESARNRNFQSASEAMETVAKLSAKLETTEKERDQEKEKKSEACAMVRIASSERDTALAELAKVKAERDEADSALRVLAYERERFQKYVDSLPHEERPILVGPIQIAEWTITKLTTELSRLRAENAAKDAALQTAQYALERIAGGDTEYLDLMSNLDEVRASLSTTPPDQVSTKGGDELCPTKCNSVSFVEDSTTDSAVQTLSRVSNAAQTSDPSAAAPPSCVPVEVLAKLVESVEDYFKSILAGDYSRLQQLGHKIDEALALAVPFLTKGDK